MTIEINTKAIKASMAIFGFVIVIFTGWCIYQKKQFSKDIERYCKESCQLYVISSRIADENLSTWSNSIGRDSNSALTQLHQNQVKKGSFELIDSLKSVTEKLEMDIESNTWGDKELKLATMDVYSKVQNIVNLGIAPDGSLIDYGQRLHALKSETDAAFTKLYLKAGISESVLTSTKADAVLLENKFYECRESSKRDAAKGGSQNFKAKYPQCKELNQGVLYSVIKAGGGPIPTEDDEVEINYTGRLENGTIFDSTDNYGFPLRCKLDQVITGLQIALSHMPVGSKWTIFIPYYAAYGDQENGSIPPYSNLIFDVELISRQ